MTNRTMISELKSHIGQRVSIAGWVRTIRNQKRIKFLIIRDVSGEVQAIAPSNHASVPTIAELTPETVVRINGKLKSDPQAPSGIEVEIGELEILSRSEPELPIPIVTKKGEADQSKRLDWRWLDLRRPERQLIFRVWTEMERAFRAYCVGVGYFDLHSPKLMSAPSESGAELFEVRYFNRKAYLAQSPQFYKQMAMAAGFEKVFEVGPVFRADPSFTSRHTTEFTGYDIEISFVESHFDVMAEQERIVVAMLKGIRSALQEPISRTFGQEITIPSVPFPKITLREAKEILKRLEIPSERENDLAPEEERRLGEYAEEQYGHEFLFVTDYPVEARPFYHMRSETDQRLTKSFDLLFKGVEITTGAQREHRFNVLVQQAQEKGLRLETIKFYLNFFKFGCPPHGGLGFGPSRFVMQLLGLPNIREATYLPRTVNRLDP